MQPGLSQTFCEERGDSYEGTSGDISRIEVNFGWKRENHMHKLPFSNGASDLFAGQCTFARDARMVSGRCGSYCTPSTQEMSYAFPSIIKAQAIN